MVVTSCCGVTKDAPQSTSQHSNAIDKQLARDHKVYRETHRLLLLGAGESGKSTIIKQMQIINMEGFSVEERKNTIADIDCNLRDALTSMLHAMKTITPPIVLSDASDVELASYFLDVYGMNCTCEFERSSRFFDSCERLWGIAEVKECYARSNEYHLADNAKYFLDRIAWIREDSYLPNEQDMLRCRVLTSTIRQIKFKVKEVSFHMYDVGGQRDQRRKWIQCFNDASAIVFVASLAAYNLYLREDNTTNRLQESLDLFRQVWTNRFLAEVSLILFLNKTDLLLEKLTSGQHPIEEYFPSFEFYQPPILKKDDECSSVAALAEPPHFVKAKLFFRDCFLTHTQTPISAVSRESRLCFPHFTCAVDTDNMRKIFEDCRLMIIRIHLDRFGILALDT